MSREVLQKIVELCNNALGRPKMSDGYLRSIRSVASSHIFKSHGNDLPQNLNPYLRKGYQLHWFWFKENKKPIIHVSYGSMVIASAESYDEAYKAMESNELLVNHSWVEPDEWEDENGL